MTNILLAFILSFSTLASGSNDEYKSYCNDRFSFCIKYPTEFTKGEESQNGDGNVFTSKDRTAEIRAYGRLAVEDLDKLDDEFRIATETITVSYKVKKKDWFVFSGTDKSGKIVYQKTVKKAITYFGDANTNVFQTLRIVYPSAKKDTYASYCKMISKSL